MNSVRAFSRIEIKSRHREIILTLQNLRLISLRLIFLVPLTRWQYVVYAEDAREMEWMAVRWNSLIASSV